MKKLKIYKSLAVLASGLSISLIAGCTSEKEEERKRTNTEKTDEYTKCGHAIIQFGNQQIILRECAEDYHSIYSRVEGTLIWNIYDTSETNKGTAPIKESFDASTYTIYKVAHKPGEVPELEQKAIDDGAYVYTYHK